MILEYCVATGAGLTAEQASDGLFPDAETVVLANTEIAGRSCIYWFLVDWGDREPGRLLRGRRHE